MNKKPVLYMQTDPRWKNKDYSAAGESTTIGRAGCGPTCAAMLLTTLTGQEITPVDTCAWSLEHGYKAKNQGTYYAYFKPQFAAYGIDADQMSWVNTYGKPNHENHDKALEMLKQGYYIIACMGKGLWTSSGHFIVMWWQDDKVRILDPASTKDSRVNGDIETFRSQVKYYFWVDAREYNEEDEEVTYEQWKTFMDQYRAELAAQPATLTDHVQEAIDMGITTGERPCDLATREEVMTMVKNAVKE